MNNLKKTVAVVIALAMVLSMGVATSFAAFSDVPSTVNYAEAVNILSNLGVINGYEDGTFKPDNTITRAEVATIIVNVLNLPQTQGATVFSDVPADHWAAGYINTAYNQQVISGMGDGTFAPGANVTYEQVVRMIVSALQYNMAANQAGGYPTGYLSVAANNGITKGAAGTVGQPATRATVAKLVYNALEVPMLAPSEYGWTADNNRFAPDETKTLLSNLGVEVLEVVVSDTYLTKSDFDADDTTVKLTLNKSYSDDECDASNYLEKDNIQKKGTELTADFEEGGTAAASLLGYACVAYVGEDSDTGEDTIFAISAKGTRNTVTTVKGTSFVDDQATYADAENRVYYYSGGDKPKSLTPARAKDDNGLKDLNFEDYGANYDDTDADYAKIYVNYEFGGNDGELTPFTTSKQYHDFFEGNGGTARFIDNDSDGQFEYVIVSKYTSESVIESVEEEDGIWSFEVMDGESIDDYDEDDDDVLKLFIKGENYINVSEIAAGDTITTIDCAADGDKDIVLYYVSSNVVEGSPKSYSFYDDTIKINNVEYSVSPLAKGFTTADLRDVENATFYINADGLIAYYDATAASVSGEYAYVTYVANNNSGRPTDNYEVELVDSKGEVHTYGLNSKVKYYDGDKNKANSNIEKPADVASALNDLFGVDPDDYDSGDYSEDKIANRIIRYQLNGNKIKTIYVNTYEDFEMKSVQDRTYDAEDNTVGSATFGKNAVVFALNINGQYDKDNVLDTSNVGVGAVSKYFVDDNQYTVYYYGDPDDEESNCILVIDPETAIDKAQNVFVVSNVEVDEIDDEIALTVRGIQNGKSKSITIFDPNDTAVAEDFYNDDGSTTLVKGSILLIGEPEGEYTTDIEPLVLTAVDEDNDKNLAAVAPTLAADVNNTDKDGDNFIVQDIDEVNMGATEDAAKGRVVLENYGTGDKGYSARTSTAITVVDATRLRLSNVDVKSGGASDLHVTNTSRNQYSAFVFFRAYDVSSRFEDDATGFDLEEYKADVKDVVIYKFNADDLAPSSAPAEEASLESVDNEDEVLVDDEVEVVDDVETDVETDDNSDEVIDIL